MMIRSSMCMKCDPICIYAHHSQYLVRQFIIYGRHSHLQASSKNLPSKLPRATSLFVMTIMRQMMKSAYICCMGPICYANLTGQTIITNMQRPHEEEPYGGSAIHETAVKRRDQNNEALSKELLITPSPFRMHLYRPATLKLIATMPRPYQQTNNTLTYVLLTKINAIRLEGIRYWFHLSDETADGANLQVYYSKPANPNEKGVSQLEFEGESGQGQPYFWVWLRTRQDGWSIELVQRACEEAVGYHWCSVMVWGGGE